MIKFDFKTSKDDILGNTLDLSNDMDTVRTHITDIVKMLDFHNVKTVKIVIKKVALISPKREVVITLKSFEDVVEFCQCNEDLVVTFVTKSNGDMTIFTKI